MRLPTVQHQPQRPSPLHQEPESLGAVHNFQQDRLANRTNFENARGAKFLQEIPHLPEHNIPAFHRPGENLSKLLPLNIDDARLHQ